MASWTEALRDAQKGKSEKQRSIQEQQPVYTSMAGEDGSLVMLEPLYTDGDVVPPSKHQEAFVLLDGIPQVRPFCAWDILEKHWQPQAFEPLHSQQVPIDK